jgi:hypothetical protein
MYPCSSAIVHKHYTTSWKLQIQQWVVWKESVANCKSCKAITSLLFCVVGVWSKCGFKGLFSKLKKDKHSTPWIRKGWIHLPCCQLSKTSAASKKLETRELGNLRLQWVQDNWELGEKTSSDWEKKFWTVIQLGIPLFKASTWRSLTSWFDPVVLNAP